MMPASDYSQLQTAKETKPQIKFYHWKYDDNSQGFAIFDNSMAGKGSCVFQGECSQKRERKRVLKGKKAEFKDSNKEIVSKKLKIRVGISPFIAKALSKRDPYAGEDGLEELVHMLCACGEDRTAKKEILTLVASVLAGYCVRICYDSYSDYVPLDSVRAPIVTVKYGDYVYDLLTAIIRSLAVDTSLPENSKKGQRLLVKYCPVLPRHLNEREITDCAYIKFSGTSKRMIPQYRDTTLLVNSRFFSSSALLELQSRNRWVSMVFYDMPKRKALITPIEINGSVLNHSDCDWNEAHIQFVVQRYVAYLAKHMDRKKWNAKIKESMSEFNEMIANYNAQPDVVRIRRLEKFQVVLQLLSLKLLMKSCIADDDLDNMAANKYLTGWYNTLLPGCCTTLKDEAWEEESEKDLQQQFEDAIYKILEKGYPRHFLAVSKDETFDAVDPEDASIHYWGYLKYYAAKKQEPFAALMFRRDQLEPLLSHYCKDIDEKELLKVIREMEIKYIHKVDKARMDTDKSKTKPVSAFVFAVEKMDFLPLELKSRLLQQAEKTR